MSTAAPLRVAVVGGGWSGLAAAVEATGRGHAVTLFEMAPALGGRARRVLADADGVALDNGQHILIGAYRATLALMARVGVDPARALLRQPLALVDPHGDGLRLPPGAAVPAFVRGVLAARGWSLGERLALLRAAGGWLARGFRCPPDQTVATLTAGLPDRLRQMLIEPLCVAALNTPSAQASAAVFLRVLRDALFSGPGAADLLLPRADLGQLLPDAASTWLQAHGARIALTERVQQLERIGGTTATAGWVVDGQPFDRVVLACTSTEAARLAEPHAPAWATTARGLRHEPIVTVLLRAPGSRLAAPMLALHASATAPAQIVFDLGQLRDADDEPGAAGLLAFVVSGAAAWVARGLPATTAAVQAQAQTQLGHCLTVSLTAVRTLCDKRATFLCTPQLARPPLAVADGLVAAGDHVAGPYPATLEGAVLSGLAAARAVG